MATEEKKYLINIESNLDQYAKDADEARKKVEELTIENYKLKNSDNVTTEQLEKSNAALRVAQKEYKSAKTSLDNVTQANKTQALSYDQLYRQWTLAQKELKAMGNAYVLNKRGALELSDEYKKQSKVVADAKKSLDQFGKGINDNRLNVGNYTSALQGLPGPIGQAVAGIQRFATALKGLLLNPIVLAIAAITLALVAMYKALKSTDTGATEFAARLEQLKVIVDVFRQRIITLASAIGNVFKGEWKKAGEDFKETFTGIRKQIDEATSAAYKYQYALDKLGDSEANYVSRSAELKREIAKLEYSAQDRTKSTKEREEALREAIKLSEQLLFDEKQFAKDRLNTEAEYLAGKNGLRKEDVLAFITMTDEQQANANEEMKSFRNNNEAKIKELDKLYADWIDKDTQFYTENKLNLARMTVFIENERKKNNASRQKELEANATSLMKSLEDEINAQLQLYEKADDYEKNRQLINSENRLAVQEMSIQNEFQLKQEQLNNDRELELAMAEKTGADILLINQKYAAYQKKLDYEVAQAKLKIYADFAGSVAALFGEQTKLGRIAAVAQTAINTYAAAMSVFKDTPGGLILRTIAAAATVATGLATIKKILEVKSGLPGDDGGAPTPTAITSMPAAQRNYSTPIASTSITQPQMTQQQLNVLPQQNISLTAQDIAYAVSKLPNPIVTVEDINAKAFRKNKVEVRAII